MKKESLLSDIRIIALLIVILASLCFIYVYPSPSPNAGINGNLKYGLDLVGGSWLQLKLEGTLVKINASNTSLNETAIANFLEKKLNTEVRYYHTMDNETVYEIRKGISKDNLSVMLKEINGSIGKKKNGEDFFEKGVTRETRDEVRRVLEEKINMLGLAGTTIRTVGNNLVLIDLPGIYNVEAAKSIVGEPGKFEIRIQTKGEKEDVGKGKRLEEIENVSVHVVGSEGIIKETVGIIPRQREDGTWGAPFTLTKNAAIKLRNAAKQYHALDEPEKHNITMLLDDEVFYSAPLSEELANEMKRKPVGSLSAGTGVGEEGEKKAKEVLIHMRAGVLPVNVNIIGEGEVPAYLGEKFKVGALIAGLFSLLFVTFSVFLRYRSKKIVLPIFFVLLSEVIIILGFAAVIKWQLDLPSIAGIIVVIGTGVDQLVIITDEMLSGGRSSLRMYRKRISFAFDIIFVSATTTIAAMFALALMALGALRGFAIVTIFGLLIGIFISRPAYARIIEKIV